MKTIELKLVNPDAKLPEYKTSGAAALDLSAMTEHQVKVYPGRFELIQTGIAISINDPSIGGFLFSRSGHGLISMRLGNCVGIIDSDYQGEIGVIIFNDGDAPYYVEPGDRIAQLVFMPVIQANLLLVNEFSETSVRGEGGFGSTGK